jgi:flagellar protein FliS
MYTDPRTAHAAYRHGQVSSAGPLRIIVLLYEAAIHACRTAEERFDEPRARGESLGRAHSIVSELLAALNHEKGGEIASNLDALYRFVLDSITRANVEGDRAAIRPILQILETLLSGWHEIEGRRDLELPKK